eukprot:gene16450-3453_t
MALYTNDSDKVGDFDWGEPKKIVHGLHLKGAHKDQDKAAGGNTHDTWCHACECRINGRDGAAGAAPPCISGLRG